MKWCVNLPAYYIVQENPTMKRSSYSLECVWCGLSESLGAVLNPMHKVSARDVSYKCADTFMCEKRIRTKLMTGLP